MPEEHPVDTRGRPIRDLRISVTDRCNLRCPYCMPAEVFTDQYPYLKREEILSFEEIVAVAQAFAKLGVHKLRLTGGEPLLRRNIVDLVAQLAKVEGITDLALTTNGLLLPELAHDLKRVGLHRLTVSLDTLDDDLNGRMNGKGIGAGRVLAGIDAAVAAGFDSVKVNMVVQRGHNDSSVLPMLEHFRQTPHVLRFIEFMDVGNSNGWNLEQVVPAQEIIELVRARWPIEAVKPSYTGEVAKRWRFLDEVGGEFGLITSVSNAFCGDCHRARLSARGEVFTCLFANQGTDLRDLLRSGAGPDALARFLRNLWAARDDRYSELRATGQLDGQARVEMSYIGG